MSKDARDKFRAFKLIAPLLLICAIVVACGVAMFWPQTPQFKVMSIVPDSLNPIEIADDVAWTNWNALISITNPNFFPLWAKEIDMRIYFVSNLTKLAALAHALNLAVDGKSSTATNVSLKIPLYTDDEGKNLIGECMSKETLDVRISILAAINICTRVDILLKGDYHDEIRCGNMTKSDL